MKYSQFSHTMLGLLAVVFLLPVALTAPQPAAVPEALNSPIEERTVSKDDYAPMLIPREASLNLKALAPHVTSRNLLQRAAGLAWGPIYIGNLKLTLTNPHDGYAGPKFPNANHVVRCPQWTQKAWKALRRLPSERFTNHFNRTSTSTPKTTTTRARPTTPW